MLKIMSNGRKTKRDLKSPSLATIGFNVNCAISAPIEVPMVIVEKISGLDTSKLVNSAYLFISSPGVLLAIIP